MIKYTKSLRPLEIHDILLPKGKNGISGVKRNHVGQAVVQEVPMSIYLVFILIGFVIGLYIGFGLAIMILVNKGDKYQ